MSCETYQHALRDAAVSGELSAKLHDHLAACSSCRAAFAQEQSLYTTIDSALHTAANAEVPATLIPRVHVALNSEPRIRYTFQNWIFASSVAVAALAALLFFNRDRGRLDTPSANLAVPTTSLSPPREQPSAVLPVAAPVRRKRSVTQVPADLSIADDAIPQVLLLPGQREATDRFVLALRDTQFRKQLMAKSADKETALQALAVKPIEIEPLAPVSTTGD